ncbi:hypothetical protein MMC22_005843 [Lobaria immixta]|nr:hypothetical protein [Lobaria immixta]
MSSSPSSPDPFILNLGEYSLPVLDTHEQHPVTGDDEEEQCLDRELQSFESRAEETVNTAQSFVSLPQVELSRSHYDGQNHQPVGRDEATSPTPLQQSNRPTARSLSTPSPRINRRAVQRARRAGLNNPNQNSPKGNFPRETVQRLLSWYDSHKNYPYPKKNEVIDLANQTNLTADQVQGWFKRTRKSARNKHEQSHHLLHASAPQTISDFDRSLVPEPLDSIMEAESPSASLQVPSLPYQSISALDTYLHTSSRDEGFPRLTADNLRSDDNPYFSTRGGHTVGRPSTFSPTPNEAETIHERPPLNQFSSQQSGISYQSSDTAGRPKGKKGRRMYEPPPFAASRQDDKKFQCTWCNRGHRYRSDWVRHEEMHNPQHKWICMHRGPRLFSNGDTTCGFCGEFNPGDEHLNSEHYALPCSRKPEDQRTFPRADGLLRHMKESHKASIQTPPDSWRVPEHENDTQQFWCGFCDEYGGYLRTTWESRLDHMEQHFIGDDLDMTRWRPEPNLPDDILTPNTTTNPYFPTLFFRFDNMEGSKEP